MKHAAPTAHLTAKTVGVAFVLSLAMFCGMLFLPGLLDRLETADPAEADASPGVVHTAILFFRDTVDTLTGAVVLTCDTRSMTVQAVGYAPDTPVGSGTLQTAYRDGGTVYAQSLLCEAEEMEVDGAMSFPVSGVAAFIVYLQDRLPLTLPEAVGELPAGASTLTPMQVADVLRYDGWTQGSAQRARIHGAVVAALINRYLTADRDLEAAFKQLTALCDDELSISQFAAVQDELAALAAANDGTICVVKETA